jgi:type II secretory pathway component GspD/PulD (secretin)
MRRLPLHPTLALALLIVLALPAFLHAGDEARDAVLITAAYDGADVRTVVADIAQQAQANIIISQEFKGTLTVTFQEVPWRQALEQVVRTAGFALVEEDYGILRVLDGRSELGTATYRFRHRLPETPTLTTVVPGTEPSLPPLVAALQRIVEREHGEIRYLPAQKSVVFTGTPRTLETVRLLLAAFDQPPPETPATLREYEDRLVGSRTELAAKYFLARIAEIRGE